MKFRLVSDLHLDFSNYIVTSLPDDKETVLIVAGDTCEGRYRTLLFNFLDNHYHRFLKIVFVLGNHCYYGENFYTHGEVIQKEVQDNYHNVVFLNDTSYKLSDDIQIVGSTLWTDFDKGSPIMMGDAVRCMADYMWIYSDDSGYSPIRLTPNEIYSQHKASVAYLKAAIHKYRNLGRSVVVVTHHAPTWQSVGDGFEGDGLNGAFVSDLSDLILDTKPVVWCHGHTHSARDYMVGDTRVLCNPRGYHSSRSGYGEKTNWNPDLIFEVE